MTPSPGRSPRYRSLDVWRGIICLFVVLEHAGVALWPGAYEAGWLAQAIERVLSWNLGTPLFFVISGYCIAASVDSTRRKGGSPLAFLGRRLWRIFPPYWAALLGFVVLVAVLDGLGLDRLHRSIYSLELSAPTELSRAQWMGNVTLTESWRMTAWGGAPVAIYTRVAWALCYQEQFYLICFLALVLAPKRLYKALGVATAAIVLFRVAAWDSGGLGRIEGMFPMLWHEFAIGLALYWRLNVPASPRARRALDLGLVGLFLVACRDGYTSTIAAGAFGLVLLATHRFDERVAAITALNPLRACGRRSFSIYLAHMPVCVVGSAVLAELGLTGYASRAFVMVPLVSLAAFGAGWVFHWAIDRHFQQPPKLRLPKLRLPLPLRLRPVPTAPALDALAGGLVPATRTPELVG
jgi:peptidoglycan/LPS O-acetylase OafA/YrhL